MFAGFYDLILRDPISIYEPHKIDLWLDQDMTSAPTFCEMLFSYLNQKQYQKDSEFYRKAGIDSKLFSKLRSNPGYHPSKKTAIALALALELDQTHTDLLLASAGYVLSDSRSFDRVIKACIRNGLFDIEEINHFLYYKREELLPAPFSQPQQLREPVDLRTMWP